MNDLFSQAISFETAKKGSVSQLLVALASNHQADIHLGYAITQLATLGEIRVSSVFVNPDYRLSQASSTAPLLPDQDSSSPAKSTTQSGLPIPFSYYSNQCAVIQLSAHQPLAQLIHWFKSLEDACHRQRSQYTQDPQLANSLIKSRPSSNLVPQNLAYPNNLASPNLVTLDIDVLAIKQDSQQPWLAIDKRYPFKVHEMVGINELYPSA